MKKTAFLITSIIMSLIILIIFFLVFISSISANSGNYVVVRQYTHSYTKAFCSLEKYCEDYEIFCQNENFIGMRSTGTAVQFRESWQDPRDEETRNNICD